MSQLPADVTMTFEFPRLPQPLQATIEDKSIPAAASVYLPKDYSSKRSFPLILWIGGGGGGDGRHTRAARKIVGDRGFVCANLPLFKRRVAALRKDEKNYWMRMLIRESDSKIIWDTYSVMLERIFSAITNIDPEKTFMGGFSNGGHTTAVLLNRRKAEICNHFRHFFLIEGGYALKATPALEKKHIIIMQGAKSKKKWLRPAHEAARKAGARVRFRNMKGVGHEFPVSYKRELKAWIKKRI